MSNFNNLTDIERLILINQYEILHALKPDQEYDKLSEQLRDGHQWLYKQIFSNILCKNLPDFETDYVLDILNLFSILKDSYKQLEDKSEIDEHFTNFIGFDGNNECAYLSFADALSESGRYKNIMPNGCPNSHCPTTNRYKKMLSNWTELGKPNYPLLKEQIQAIIKNPEMC
ncbi:MAG: YfbU family protein [Neisseriaceae bacterium]